MSLGDLIGVCPIPIVLGFTEVLIDLALEVVQLVLAEVRDKFVEQHHATAGPVKVGGAAAFSPGLTDLSDDGTTSISLSCSRVASSDGLAVGGRKDVGGPLRVSYTSAAVLRRPASADRVLSSSIRASNLRCASPITSLVPPSFAAQRQPHQLLLPPPGAVCASWRTTWR